jgi:dTDP-4-amino-4,6-dideoxygalactose transaminase
MSNTINVTKSSMPPYEEFIEAIKPLWESKWLTNMGKYHNELQAKLREYLGVDELSLMVNGHMALELAIQAFGFPEGGEVITTPFTFISTTHAIVRNKLVPVFCDVKPEDGTIDEKKIESLITERTVAILPVHVYGNICNTKEIERIAYKYNLKVIYDAAHAFGETVAGKGIGDFGDASCFSFHATKVYNTIEGGAVSFHDHWIYEKLYNLKNFGIRGELLVTEVGANAKMNEICAIMGLCNLNHIEEAINKRKSIYDEYIKFFINFPGIKVLRNVKDNETNNYAYFPIIIEDGYKSTRDGLYDRFRANHIHARKYFYPLTADQACFRNKYMNVKLDTARELSEHVLTIPIFEDMTSEEQKRVLDCIV